MTSAVLQLNKNSEDTRHTDYSKPTHCQSTKNIHLICYFLCRPSSPRTNTILFDKERLTSSAMANYYNHNNHSFTKDTDPDRNFSFFNKQQSYEYNINDLYTISKPYMFSIIHTNIRSLPKNIDNLVIFLILLNRNLSCIGISETWLNDISPIDTFNIPNYTFLCKSRSSKLGGCVGCNTYNFKERTDLNIFYNGIFESIFAEIETANLEKTLIGVIYCPPEYSNLDLFHEYIQTILHKLSKTKNL